MNGTNRGPVGQDGPTDTDAPHAEKESADDRPVGDRYRSTYECASCGERETITGGRGERVRYPCESCEAVTRFEYADQEVATDGGHLLAEMKAEALEERIDELADHAADATERFVRSQSALGKAMEESYIQGYLDARDGRDPQVEIVDESGDPDVRTDGGCPLCALGSVDEFPVFQLEREDRFVANPSAAPARHRTDHVALAEAVRERFDVDAGARLVERHLNRHVLFEKATETGVSGT